MPATEYYNSTGTPVTMSAGESAAIRAEFNIIQAGFGKLPDLSGNADKAIFVNASGNALVAYSSATARSKLGALALADFSVSSGSSLIGFIQSGSGAVATDQQTKTRWTKSVFDRMTAAEIADVQAFTYAIDVSAKINAAFAADKYVDIPEGGYRIGSQLTMQAQGLGRGHGRRSSIFKKYFNGDMFASLPHEAGFTDMYFDGNGASFTGRIFPVTGTDSRQYAHRCVIKDAESYCIEFTAIGAGSQSAFIDCEIARYDGLTAGKYSVKVVDTQQLAATPRSFIGVQSNGTYFIDFGGGNNFEVLGCFSGGYRFTPDSRAVHIVGGRIANIASLNLDGNNNTITGCGINPNLILVAGTSGWAVQGNSYNGTVTDNSGQTSNQIDIWSFSYTPTWTGSGSNPAIGNGTLRGEYSRNGDVIDLAIELIIGSTTTFGTGTWQFSVPVPPALASGAVQSSGSAYILDAGTTTYSGMAQLVNAASIITITLPGGLTSITPTTPMTWATGDILRIGMRYLI